MAHVVCNVGRVLCERCRMVESGAFWMRCPLRLNVRIPWPAPTLCMAFVVCHAIDDDTLF